VGFPTLLEKKGLSDITHDDAMTTESSSSRGCCCCAVEREILTTSLNGRERSGAKLRVGGGRGVEGAVKGENGSSKKLPKSLMTFACRHSVVRQRGLGLLHDLNSDMITGDAQGDRQFLGGLLKFGCI